MKKKEDLIAACQTYVEKRIDGLHQGIADLEEALKLETKCSAGDKYETSRAMLHLEFEKLSGQLEQYARLKKTVALIRMTPSTDTIGFGSVVETEAGNYIIAIPAGKFLAEGQEYFAIGAVAPIAQAMQGKKVGESFSFNGKLQKIIRIY